MYRRARLVRSSARSTVAAAIAWLLFTGGIVPVQAQLAPGMDLRAAYAATWSRQPEAASLQARRESAAANRDVADAWTPLPPSVDVFGSSDRATRDDGRREYEAGVAIPLWLPGERRQSQSLADALSSGVETRVRAAQLRTAAAVREAYWNWQLASLEWQVAQDRQRNAALLAQDVARRVTAGDLARADSNQAAGALAAAQSLEAEARGALAVATQDLVALTGQPWVGAPISADAAPEPLPPIGTGDAPLNAAHPLTADVLAQVRIARESVELARVQTRANPELVLGTTRERELAGDRFKQVLTVGVRIPFGSDARVRTRLAAAQADALEADTQARLTQERLIADLEASRQQVTAARDRQDAAQRRADLAQETRGFVERAFQLGNTDLPTRLRIELEAVEAARQAVRSRIAHAASVSALRQSLGLLPE